MKTIRFLFTAGFFLSLTAFSAAAQAKVIMITENGDSTQVYVDSLNNPKGYAFFFDDKIDELGKGIDSLMNIKRSNIDSIMRTMAIKFDSLQQKISWFSIDIDDDFFKNAFPSDSDLSKMMNINMDLKVNIDTLEDGKIVKSIVMSGTGDESKEEHHIVISSDDGSNGKFIIKGDEPEDELLTDIPVSDLHILKKAGFSTAMFSEEPLMFKNENINVERKVSDKKDILDISIKADLPSKGKTTITLVDKNGKIVSEDKMKNSEKINEKFTLSGDSAPYFIIVVQGKKAWAKKVAF